MREIKVAELTEQEVREFHELSAMRDNVRLLQAQFSSASSAFWERLATNHQLPYGHHSYCVGAYIYRQDIDTEGEDANKK